MLKELKESEHLNLKHLNEKLVNKLNSLDRDISKLFAIFCFVLICDKEIQLVLNDAYIPERELKLYKKIVSMSYFGKLNEQRSLLNACFQESEINEVNINIFFVFSL